MDMNTAHSIDRINERLTAAGWSESDKRKLAALCDKLARDFGRSQDVAVKILSLPKMVGAAYGNVSNGNEVWAIIRSGKVITVMLRRENQPKTAAALKVDVVKVLS